MIKHEVRTLASKDIDGVLMYPGKFLFTWVKVGGMPWVLASIESVPA